MRRYLSFSLALLICLTALLCSCSGTEEKKDDGRLNIITTVFPLYDLARAVGGDCVSVTNLLPPGGDSHSFEPTPKDIAVIDDISFTDIIEIQQLQESVKSNKLFSYLAKTNEK